MLWRAMSSADIGHNTHQPNADTQSIVDIHNWPDWFFANFSALVAQKRKKQKRYLLNKLEIESRTKNNV